VYLLEVEEPKGMWTAGWSNAGTSIAAVGRSGKGYVFDPRKSTTPTVTKALPIQPLKPVRLVWIDDKIFLTGWDQSRNRLYALINPSDLSTVFTQNLDTNLSPLLPIIDEERKIVYVAGRRDMNIRQVELGGVTGFQETVHPLPYALASTGLAAVHPTHLDVMQAEVGRVLIPVVDKDGDAILPLGIRVPRRQLIDYHEDLYPDIMGSSEYSTVTGSSDDADHTVPEQSSQEWLAGGDARPLPFTLDPSRRSIWEARLAQKSTTATASGSSARTEPTAVKEVSPPLKASDNQPSELAENTPQPSIIAARSAPEPAGQVSVADQPTPSQVTGTQGQTSPSTSFERPVSASPVADQKAAGSSSERKEPEKSPSIAQAEQTTEAPSQPAQSTSVSRPAASYISKPSSSAPQNPSDRYNPGWSRKFLAGKSPLNPTYDSVPALSSLHQDSVIFKVNARLAFFAVQGPGGRLGVHPLKKKGRMSTGGEGYLSGGVEIADFDIEPFGNRVVIAGEDGVVRLWTVGEDGIQGVGPEAEQVIKGDGIDKIATVAFHPTAKDLLTVLTNDQGTCAVRLFDLKEGKEVKKVTLDLDGAFNMIWSPRGDRVAVATRDGRILTLDPRRPDSQITGSAHDSPRSFQITWIDETHLLSVGFSRGSQRRINLYEIANDTIKTLSSFMMDISPSVLFPQYDPDTNILYVWGKGERQIQAFEIHPNNTTEPIAKLPSFTSGSPQLGVSFFAKRLMDVKKVEVGKCLRLTAKAIEEVSFSIPRNKPDFFQDDIYVDTLDVERSNATVQEWLDGKQAEPRYMSLKPDGMTLRKPLPCLRTLYLLTT